MFGNQMARYDLRIDRSCFFVPTNQSAGSKNPISGTFCLSLPEAVWVKSIKLILTSSLRIPVDGVMTTKNREHDTRVHEQELASSKSHSAFKMPTGKYEFPFEIPLPKNLPETVTGPGHNYRTYQIHAIVERAYWKDAVISQPLRIYNAPDIESDNLWNYYPLVYYEPFPTGVVKSAKTHQTVEGQSDQNIRHCASIPSSYIPFGSKFSVECAFQIPSKDAKLRTITIEVVEKHTLLLDATAAEAALGIFHITTSRDHTISKKTLEPSAESALVSCTGTEWCINTMVSLPGSLDLCSQSVMTRTIKILHSLVVTAQFQHEDGQLLDTTVTTIPFSIYMAPSNIGPNGNVYSKVIEHNI